jgi:hypothetical protein
MFLNENIRYLEHVWFVMHHSDDPNKFTFAISCYLDDSGTDKGSPQAVVGGLWLDKLKFSSFCDSWSKLLVNYNINNPLHMKEFSRPHGRLAFLSNRERHKLFSKVQKLINSHKIFSIGGTINQKQYLSLQENIKNAMSIYGFGFILCVYLNHNLASNINYRGDIAYVLDELNEKRGQILEAHAEMKRLQEKEFRPFHIGSILFDDDKRILPLQASDVIAWGIHRRDSGKSINQGFEPIKEIFKENHYDFPWTDDELQELSKALAEYL